MTAANNIPESIEECYRKAFELSLRRFPYVYGGGHPGFGPSGNPTGYDCSGWASTILHAGGILGSSYALDTQEFEEWGDPGRGRYMTLWVINDTKIKHCFIEFNITSAAHRWSVAPDTGMTCGWYPFMPTLGYSPRRRK